MVYAKGRVFYCDTEADLRSLPTNRTPGCVAKILETSDIYQLNSSGTWILQTNSSGGGEGGGSSIQDIYISSAHLDEDENLILEFNAGLRDPIEVNLGSINQSEIFLLQKDLEALGKIEPSTQEFITSLFK